MKDWRGVEFNIGDTILYARSWGSGYQMVEAEVVRFGTDKDVVEVRPVRSSRGTVQRDREYRVKSRIFSRDTVTLRNLRNITVPFKEG